MIHHVTRATRHLIFWTLIALAIGMTGIRLALIGVDSYKSKLAGRISELLEVPVTIGRLGANMRGFSPELVLSDIAVAATVADDQPSIRLKQIRIGIHLLDSIIHRDLLSSSWITLVGAKMSVLRKADGSFEVIGLKAGDGKPLWLLQGGRYEVLDSEITWQDELGEGRRITFDSVALALINDGERHRINALTRLPKHYGDRIRLSFDITGNPFGPAAIDGTAYVDGRRLQLPEWLAMELPMAVSVTSGLADFQVWGELKRSELVSLAGTAHLENLNLHRKAVGALPIEQLNSRFSLRWTEEKWRLDVKQFQMSTNKSGGNENKVWPDAIFGISGSKLAASQRSTYAGFIEQLDLQEAALISNFFLPADDEHRNRLQQLALTGELDKISWLAEPEAGKLAVNGNFANLGFSSMMSIPGLSHLSGHVRGDEQKGVVHIDSHAGQLRSDLFRNPLPVDRLSGIFSWRQEADRWLVISPSIELDSLSLKSKSRFRLQLAKNGGDNNFVDLQSAFIVDDASQANRYWPTKIMDEETVDWLDRAFVKGRIPNGGFLLYGNPKDFPFKDGSGVFEVNFDATELEMNYEPSWPPLLGVDAAASFYADGLSVSVKKGYSRRLAIKQAQVAIPSLDEKATLKVKGEAEGSIVEALAFLQQTPLHAPVDKVMEVISPVGNTRVKLDLSIPLVTDDEISVDGSAQLANAKIQVKPLSLPVTQVNGQLRFDVRGIYSHNLSAHALGHPIQIDIDNTGLNTDLNVSGRVEVDSLKEQFKMPGWQVAAGATDYRLQLRLPNDGGAPVLRVTSELQGIGLNLPSFLMKTVEERKPLALVFSLSDPVLLPITLNYDNKLKASLKMKAADQTIFSGRFLIGAGEVAQRQEAGVEIAVQAKSLDLHDWLQFAPEGDSMAYAVRDIKTIDLHLGEAFWRDANLGKLDLSLSKNDAGWNGNLGGKLAKGRIKFSKLTQGSGRIELDLDRFELSAFKSFTTRNNQPEKFLAPQSVPLIAIKSKETYWQSTLLGELTLKTARTANGMVFKQMDLIGSEQKLAITGDWTAAGKESLTHTRGRLELIKGGNLFAKLGISKDLTETDGRFDFTLNWQAAPHQFSLERLQGQLDVDLKSGRILSIEPGFGRILGFLAMNQWVKRLQLDFSDVFQEGLTFNSIKGGFLLSQGKAVTNNLLVDAVPAKIALSGETDLIQRTIDQVVEVTPKSADALPIAGTIMGKVASFVAKSLTGAEREGFFFGSQYRLTGKWGDVQVEPLHEKDGLLQKTWNGITDFSWLEQQKTK